MQVSRLPSNARLQRRRSPAGRMRASAPCERLGEALDVVRPRRPSEAQPDRAARQLRPQPPSPPARATAPPCRRSRPSRNSPRRPRDRGRSSASPLRRRERRSTACWAGAAPPRRKRRRRARSPRTTSARRSRSTRSRAPSLGQRSEAGARRGAEARDRRHVLGAARARRVPGRRRESAARRG